MRTRRHSYFAVAELLFAAAFLPLVACDDQTTRVIAVADASVTTTVAVDAASATPTRADAATMSVPQHDAAVAVDLRGACPATLNDIVPGPCAVRGQSCAYGGTSCECRLDIPANNGTYLWQCEPTECFNGQASDGNSCATLAAGSQCVYPGLWGIDTCTCIAPDQRWCCQYGNTGGGECPAQAPAEGAFCCAWSPSGAGTCDYPSCVNGQTVTCECPQSGAGRNHFHCVTTPCTVDAGTSD